MQFSRKAAPLLGLTTLAALGLGGVRPAQAQVTITNPSFEADVVPGFPGYTTAITGWTSSNSMNYPNGTNNNGTGLNNAGGPFANNGTIPDGTQVAFLQAQDATTSLTQSLSGFKPGDQYVVTFYDNARAYTIANVQSNPFATATLGGQTIVPLTEVAPVGDPNSYYFVTSVPYTATGKTADLVISSVSPALDGTLLVDDVKIKDISVAPEPSSVATVGIVGLFTAGLVLKARKRRSVA